MRQAIHLPGLDSTRRPFFQVGSTNIVPCRYNRRSIAPRHVVCLAPTLRDIGYLKLFTYEVVFAPCPYRYVDAFISRY